jgi:hypothetical protein
MSAPRYDEGKQPQMTMEDKLVGKELHFIPLKEFMHNESVYVKGARYRVRKGNDALTRAVEWMVQSNLVRTELHPARHASVTGTISTKKGN